MTKFTPIQQHILHCVRFNNGTHSRSEIAKLLAGSKSERVGGLAESPFYGRLSTYKRKEIMAQLDSLLQQGFLILDAHHNVIRLPDANEDVQ